MNWMPNLSSTAFELTNNNGRDGARDPSLDGEEREREEREEL